LLGIGLTSVILAMLSYAIGFIYPSLTIHIITYFILILILITINWINFFRKPK
jgi:hypothetical protein